MSASRSSSSSSNQSDCQQQQRQQQQLYQQRQSKYNDLSPEEFWKMKKKQRKDRVRERNKERRNQLNKEWDDLAPDEREKIKREAAEKHEQRNREQAEFLEQCQANLGNPNTPSLVFDLHFAPSMNLRGVKSTASQLKLSCSAMRKERYILRPVFVSGASAAGGTEAAKVDEGNDDANDGDGDNQHQHQHRLNEQEQKDEHKEVNDDDDEESGPRAGNEIFGQLRSFDGFKKFPLPFLDGSVVDKQVAASMPFEKIVYLTADSPNVLWDLRPGEFYVIGAFVDHNTMKNATFNYAKSLGLRTARLPLDEVITVGNRCKVLTINHVVEVLLNFAKTRDWKQALLPNLPTRRVSATSTAAKTRAEDENEAKDETNEAPQRREREDASIQASS